MPKIEVWKNSDGFITESKAVYKRRKKALKALKEFHAKEDEKFSTGKYSNLVSPLKRESPGFLETQKLFYLNQALKDAERTDKQIDDDAEASDLYATIKKEQCSNCDGKGEVDAECVFGATTESCCHCVDHSGYMRQDAEFLGMLIRYAQIYGEQRTRR